MHECSSCKRLMHECSFRALNFALVHNMHVSRHACSSSYTRQQNERLVHARVQFQLHTPTKTNVSCMQFPMLIRHRFVVRTQKMLRAFLKACRAVQLLHACVVKFKVSGTVSILLYINAKQNHLGCKKSARPIRSSIANRYV